MSVYPSNLSSPMREDVRMSDISYNDTYKSSSIVSAYPQQQQQQQYFQQQQTASQHPITAAALMMAMRTSSAGSSNKGSFKDLQPPTYIPSEPHSVETSIPYHEYSKESTISQPRESVKFKDDVMGGSVSIESEDLDSSPVPEQTVPPLDAMDSTEGGGGTQSGSRASSGTKQRSRTESVQNAASVVTSTSATMFPPINNQKSIITSNFTQMSMVNEPEVEEQREEKRGLVEVDERSSSAGTGRKHVRNKTVGDENDESSQSFFGGGEISRRSGKISVLI